MEERSKPAAPESTDSGAVPAAEPLAPSTESATAEEAVDAVAEEATPSTDLADEAADADADAAVLDGGAASSDPEPDPESELAAKAARADEYLALAQRTKADFENFRRRSIREAAAAQERGVAKLAKALLPAVDNLDRALTAAQAAAAAAGEGDEVHAQLLSGIELVHADVISALQRAGIEVFSPQGEAFDPQWHEAVAQAPVPGAESGSVVEVYQRGYRIGESVLRPARVLVAA